MANANDKPRGRKLKRDMTRAELAERVRNRDRQRRAKIPATAIERIRKELAQYDAGEATATETLSNIYQFTTLFVLNRMGVTVDEPDDD
jgi:hypothetical protein